MQYEDQGHGVIPNATWWSRCRAELYGSSKLSLVKPEKWDFYFTYGASKQVPVKFRGSITMESTYYLAHTEFSACNGLTGFMPTKKSGLTSCAMWKIEPFNYRNLQDTIHKTVHFTEDLWASTSFRMRCAFQYSILWCSWPKRQSNVPITAINMPLGMVLRTFPSRVTVRLTIGASLSSELSVPTSSRWLSITTICLPIRLISVRSELRSVPRTVEQGQGLMWRRWIICLNSNRE